MTKKSKKSPGRPAARPSASPAADANDLHLVRLRMKDLCDATGLGRQAIHFYIREGLLSEGKKTGRNMAYYTEAHIERLRLIRRLQDEQFLGSLVAVRRVATARLHADHHGGVSAHAVAAVEVDRHARIARCGEVDPVEVEHATQGSVGRGTRATSVRGPGRSGRRTGEAS